MLTYIRHQSREFSRSALVVVILLLVLSEHSRAAVVAQTLKNFGNFVDKLAYTVTSPDGKTSLMVYDPQSATTISVHTDTQRFSFSFSPDGRLAYSTKVEGFDQIYVMNTLSTSPSPVNISHDFKGNAYPLTWSRDGHYLAFQSYLDDTNMQIYVWDGTTITNVTPTDLADTIKAVDSVVWSFDERLVFTAYFTFSFPYKGDRSEVFLWDGHRTSDLSQNPTGGDGEPTWSTDGRLAFLSERDGKYGVYVWDGVSVKNGMPSVDTFTNVAPELTIYYSFPAWTNQGLLTFDAKSSQDNAQIYLWNGHVATNISQNSTLWNDSPTWNADGRWAFATAFAKQLVYARDTQNRTILTVDGKSPAWSLSDYLTFCTLRPSGWILSIWDGKQIIDIVRGEEIWAQWQSGSRSICSNG